MLLLDVFKHFIFEYILIAAIVFQVVFLIKKSKVFLKITKRIVRLFVTTILEVVLLTFFIPYLVIDLLIPLLIILANAINKPIEINIKNKFIKKAKKKISKVSCTKIAITGSYGKTSTKNFISNVLKYKYIVKSTPKSYNTPLGISKFINNEEFDFTDFMIYEFGARRVGDIKELQECFDYNISVVTSIGCMHIDTFKTLENIIKEKMSLIKDDPNHIAILNYENEYIRDFIVDCNKYTYGFNYGDFRATNIEISIMGTVFDLLYLNNFIKRFEVGLLGRAAILNLLPAIIVCYLYNIDYKIIEELRTVDNRLSLRKMNDYFILDDAYNSNIVGVSYALEVLKTHSRKKYMITPGFAEMDSISDILAKEYGALIEGCVDLLILVKNDFTLLLKQYLKNTNVLFVESFKEGFNMFLKIKESNSILLIENDLLE